MSRLNIIIMIVVLCSTLGLTYLLDHMSSNLPDTEPLPAPAFEITDIQGNTHHLSDFKGKTVLLHFWATWCAPCIVELPELFKLAQHQQDNIILLAVSIDKNKDHIDRFLKKIEYQDKHASIIIGHDPAQKISKELFQTVKLPETFVISPNGFIVDKIIGAYEGWTTRKMKKRLDKISHRK